MNNRDGFTLWSISVGCAFVCMLIASFLPLTIWGRCFSLVIVFIGGRFTEMLDRALRNKWSMGER
jgi:hypothetical protein